LTRARARLAGYGGFVIVAVLVAFWKIYAQFSNYDDEGYVLLSIKQFIRGGALYNHVFSQYGPFPYEFWGGLYSLLGRNITPDNARLVVIAMWLAIALLVGLTVERITKSLLCGLIATVVAFTSVSVITNEPMIPDGLAALLTISTISVAGLLAHRERLRMALIGILLAALLLTKINLGGSALLAVCLALSVYSPKLARHPQLMRLFVAAGVAMPFVLMYKDLGQDWAENLALLIALGVAAVGVALGSLELPRATTVTAGKLEFMWFACAFVGAILFLTTLIVILGTSPGELIHGVLIGPLGQRNAFSIAAQISVTAVDLAVAGFVCSVAARRLMGQAMIPLLAGLSRIVVAVLILLWASSALPISISPDPTTLGVALPFTWLVVRSTQPAAAEARQWLTRILLATLPVYGAIGIYPVAGSQVGYADTAFVPAAAVILADGVRQIRRLGTARVDQGSPRMQGAPRLAGLGLLAVLSYQLLLQPAVSFGSAYRSLTPLPFAGASRIRQPHQLVAAYAGLVDVLHTRCDTFLTLPGMNSFYLWANMDPPTGLNTTSWMYLLSDAQQQQVVDAVDRVPRLCLIRNYQILADWEGNGPPPMRPLLRYVSSGFEPIYQGAGYTVLVRGS
jgi:hypothetical protein